MDRRAPRDREDAEGHLRRHLRHDGRRCDRGERPSSNCPHSNRLYRKLQLPWPCKVVCNQNLFSLDFVLISRFIKTLIPQHPVHQHEPSAGVPKELALLVLLRLARQEPGGDVVEDLLQRSDHPRCQGLSQDWRKEWKQSFPAKDREGNVFGAHASTSWIDTEGGWAHQISDWDIDPVKR